MMSNFVSHFFRWGNSEKVTQPEPEPEPEPKTSIRKNVIKGTRLDIEKEVIE